MNILITGCTGSLGSLLVERLLPLGHSVTGVARDAGTGNAGKKKFRLIIADIAGNGLFEELQNVKADLVIHLAAVIPRKIADRGLEERMMFETNVRGTLNILGLMERVGIKKLIFASSMAVYGLPERLPVDEGHRLAPLTFYGLTKKQGEEYIRQACSKKGLSACIFRFPSFFGPKITAGAVYSFCSKAAANEDILINPETTAPWDLLHIKDAADVLVRCVERMQKGEAGDAGVEIFNVDYGVPVSLAKVADMVVELAGSDSKIKIAEKDRILEFFYDTGRVRKALGWKPPPLKTRLKEYLVEIGEM